MKLRFNPSLFSASLAASIVVCFGQVAHAATFTWDANAGASGQTDGAGSWSNTTGSLWWDGVSANSIWSNTGPNDAIFGNMNGAAGIVTIGTAITVGNLTFNPAGSGKYILSGATNDAANTITLSGATPTITTNQSATISARIASTNGFVKEGLGSLTLTGSAAGSTSNSIGGTITVNAGQLTVSGSPSFAGDGAFQSNLTLANFGRFTTATSDRIGNSAQITVGADAFALFSITTESLGALAGSGRITNNGTLTLTSGTQNFTGVLSGVGGLSFSGSSVSQTLSGANLFTGTTTANSSGTTLALNNVNALQNSTLSKGSSAVTFIVAGTNTYNLGGLSGASALNIGANTISVGGNNADTTYSSSIGFGTTAGGLIKVGTGKLTLSGTSIYTGATTISRGTLELTGAGGLATSGITFNGTSNFTYTGSAAGSSDSVGALTRSAGDGAITSTYGTSGNVALTFSSLAARTSGATANFVVTGGSNGTTNKIVLSSGATANAFIDQGTFFGGSNFAWYDTGGFVRAISYSGSPDTGAVTTAGGTTLAATAHQETTAAVTAQNSATFTTLKIAGAHAFTLASSQTLTVNGILKTGSTAAISGGSGIRAATNQDLVVRTDISTDALSINTPILANGNNAFVKTGAGDLTLGSLAVNTYTGGTFINQGKLIVNQDNNLGSTAAANNIQLNGGTLQPSASFSLNANHGIDVNAGGGTINGNGFQLTLGSTNMLSGSGPLTITGSSSTNSVLNSGATQDYSGRMTISSGRIVLNAANITNPYGTGDITVGAGDSSIYVNQSGSVWSNRFFISGNGGEGRGVIRMQNSGTLNGDIILTGNASISSENTTTNTLNGNISGAYTLTLGGQTSASASAKYVLTGNNVHNATVVAKGITNIDHDIALGAYNGTVTINGDGTLQAGAADIILNPDRTVAMSAASGTHNIDTQAFNMTIQGVITGAGTETFNKQGAGALTLTNANTFAGITTISGGTITAAHVSALSASSAVNISSTTGAGTLRLATDTSVDAYVIGASSNNQGTIISDRATAGAGITHLLGATQLGNNTYNIQAGSNVNSGTAAVSFASLSLSAGAPGTTVLNPTTANLIIAGAVNIGFNNHAKTLNLGGSSSGNQINGIISDGLNTLSLTKSDSSTWTLTGPNTYSGTTTITAGTLRIGVGSVGSVGAITSSAIGTGSLNLNGGRISSDSATPRTILNDVTYSTASTFGDVTNNGKLTFSAGVNLGTTQKVMTVDSETQFDGKLTGTGGGITLGTSTSLGFGKLTLTNTTNDFTGNVTLQANSGTLRITSSGALGVGPKTFTNTGSSGSVPVTGANLLELDSNGGADISLASNISFTTSGSAGVILNTAGANTINGNFNMTSGNGNTKIISNGGTLQLTGTFTSNATDRELELAGSTVGNIFSGALVNGSNTALLTKTGGGTWTVSGGSNTFTGRTKVIGGTLKLTNNLAIQNSVFDTSGAGALDTEGVTTPTFGGLTLGGNLVLHSNVTSLTLKVAGTQTYSGSLSGGTALALSKSGAGTQVLSNSNNYSGATSVSEGILNIAHNSALGSNSAVAITSTITAGGVLELANGITVTGKNITISGFGTGVRGSLRAATGAAAEWAGQVVIGGSSSPTDTRVGAMGNGTLTISGAIVNGTLNTFIVSAENAASATPGKVIVSGTSNTYSGQTQIFRGILAIGANNALPTGTVLNVHSASGISDTAQFDLNGYNQQVAGLLRGNNSGPAIVTNTGGTTKTLTINNTDVYTFDSAITGNLALVKDGAAKQTLSGTNTYNGATTINEGTLALGAAGSIDSTSGVALGGGTFDVSAKTGGYTVNNLTGSGNVVGGLTVSTELSIGNSPGQINFGGNLTLGTTLVAADFNYEFTGGDTAADLGIVSGDLTLDSKVFLNLFQLGNYTPGDTFTLFAYEGSLIGTFIGLADGDTIMDDQLNSWKIEYAATSAGQNYSGLVGQTYVNITAIPEPNVAALLGALGTLILLRRRRA